MSLVERRERFAPETVEIGGSVETEHDITSDRGELEILFDVVVHVVVLVAS